MSNSDIVIPLGEGKAAQESIAWLQDNIVLFAPEIYPNGRFPTEAELLDAIKNLGFELEKSNWEYEEILEALPLNQHGSDSAYFRSTGITLDIMQQLANICGTFLVVDTSGSRQILIVPDSVLLLEENMDKKLTYTETILKRMPHMIEMLRNATVTQARFLLSQIRQAIECSYGSDTFTISHAASEGLSVYKQYLNNTDKVSRLLAFDLITRFKSDFYSSIPSLQQAIINEEDNDAKMRKIWSLEPIVSRLKYGSGIDIEQAVKLNSTLLSIADNPDEWSPLRLSAANIAVRSQPALYSANLHKLFVHALIYPSDYTTSLDNRPASRTDEIIASLKMMLWNHRISILRDALPKMRFAWDAHQVLRTILDNIFFGEAHLLSGGSLPATMDGERPPVDETAFREHDSRTWQYTRIPTSLTISDLQAHQQEILSEVLDLDIPWMVHSNLLAKYGLPVTRSEVRKMLDE